MPSRPAPNEAVALDTDRAVHERYSAAARNREAALCCPVDYDPRHLSVIPDEVLQRDYGCGDPSRHVRPGDTVLDLGSGGGKIAFIAAQIVGPRGRVIGVDSNPDMLALARAAAPLVAERLGFANVEFRRGAIQDLALDADRLESWLREHPVLGLQHLAALEQERDRLRQSQPMIPDAGIDIVVSNCVLNLVRDADKAQLVREIHRVLRRGGRIAISDIVSDEPVPPALKADPGLWSGCIAGAFEERALLDELAAAGFHGIAIERWEARPFAVVGGIEFRALTITAHKGEQGPCWEANQAVVYRGPWRRVEDDDGHVLERGQRVAVCEKTYRLLTSEPYAGQTIGIEPRLPVRESERQPFDCSRDRLRHPRETKGADWRETRAACNVADGGCC